MDVLCYDLAATNPCYEEMMCVRISPVSMYTWERLFTVGPNILYQQPKNIDGEYVALVSHDWMTANGNNERNTAALEVNIWYLQMEQ